MEICVCQVLVKITLMIDFTYGIKQLEDFIYNTYDLLKYLVHNIITMWTSPMLISMSSTDDVTYKVTEIGSIYLFIF